METNIDTDGVKQAIDAVRDLATGVTEFKAKQTAAMDKLAADVKTMQIRANRPGSASEPDSKAQPIEQWRDAKSGRPIPVLSSGQRLADLGDAATKSIGLGRALRGLVLGSRADDSRQLLDEAKAQGIASDPSGGYTVSGVLASEWIDLLRSAMVLSRAGARTVPMPSGQVSLARITADPTVTWRGENSAVTDSEATFGAVSLHAKTCATLVKLSIELAQDSANIDSILASTITNAMAQAIDSAGLVGVTTNAGAAPGGILDLSGRNTVTSIGAPTSWDWLIDGMYELAADNVPLESIGALVAHPNLWKKMRKLKTGIASDNTPLTMPDEVARLPKLWTTACTSGKAVIADWRDLLFGVRQDITVRVLQETFLGSHLQIAVLAYARVDFAAVRQTSFCTMEGITVS